MNNVTLIARRIARSGYFLPGALLVLVLCVFGDVLIGLRPGVISSPTGDVASQFIYWRSLAANALRHGHLPQWNPHVYGGVPFFGAWQTGLLYPPNWLYLLLPLNLGLNLDPIISTYLTGLFGSLLARKYGFHTVASLVTGAVMMLGGPFFSHVWAGHLSELAAMAWTPLLLLGVESIIERPSLRPILLTAFALTMQVLAGHPQTVFNTALLVAIYALFRIMSSEHRSRIAGALICAGALGASLAAAQLLTGLQVNTEGARSTGVGITFAGLFSLSPENLLTLAVQHPFGDMVRIPYFGRWMMWEESAFVGVSALLLAFFGYLRGRSKHKGLWLGLFVLMTVLALGKYSVLFVVLYNYVPGFSMLRSHGRFMYEAVVMLALLAGSGLDEVLRKAPQPSIMGEENRRFAARVSIILGILLGAGAAVMASPMGRSVIIGIWRLGDLTFNPRTADIDRLLKAGPAFAAGQLMTSAIIAFLAGAMFWASGRNRCWAAALAALALIDLVCYARSTVTTFDPQISRPAMMANWFATHPGDYRILQQTFGFNSVMAFNQYDVWGYDPAVVRRYAQLLLAIEKQDANAPLTNAPFTYPGPGLRLVRCKYMFGDLGGRVVVAEMSDPLPHALLVHRVRRITERDIIFGALLSPSFDGRHEVVLENAPNIQPMPARNPGVVSAVWKDSDTLEVSASTASPAILLITDTYSRFWNVHPLAGCSQPEYSVMPGDYALIAIPLREGRHHFLLNYCPPIYRAGLYISLAALALFTFLCCLSYRAHKGRRTIV